MTESQLPPWEAISPELTGERLESVALQIVKSRSEKLRLRHRLDGAWNLGCDLYAWTGAALREAAEGDCRAWLRVESAVGDLDFRFRIGGPKGIQWKFYRPESEGQPARTLRRCMEELRAYPLSLALADEPATQTAVRIAIDADESGAVIFVTLVTLDQEGAIKYAWPIWSSIGATTSIRSAPQAEPVDLPEPPVSDRRAQPLPRRSESNKEER